MARRRLQAWLDRRDRNNQIVMDAMRPPSRPREPAVVLRAVTPIPDPAFAYPLQVRIDGKTVEEVPWGWSVHPLELGVHTIDLWHPVSPASTKGPLFRQWHGTTSSGPTLPTRGAWTMSS